MIPIVGLDIGSQTIRVAVGVPQSRGRLALTKLSRFPSEGLRKGMVDDVPALTRVLSAAFSDLKQESKDATKNLFVSVGSPNVRVQASRGIVAVSRADLEIYKEDVARAIEASEAVKLAANRMVLHTLTDEFAVDDISDIKDPLGMVGNRLEARSLIIDAFAPAIKNLIRAVEVAGGSIAGLIFNPLSSARAVLTKNQRDLGVCLLDIGFGTTTFAVYQEGKLLHTGAFPFGSGHVTNDLAIGLKTSIDAAERVKFAFGAALAKDVPIRENVELAKFDSGARGGASRRFIAEIVEVRLAEIFEFIHNDLRSIGRGGQLPGGIVLTGAGAKLPGIVDLAKQEFRLPARVGVPELASFHVENSELATQLDDPEYACALGLLLWGADKQAGDVRPAMFDLSGWAKRLMNYFMP